MNLSGVTSVALQGGATLFVQTDSGGTTDLSGLATISHAGTRVIDFQTYGTGSTLKLGALGPTISQVTMDVENGGTVQWGAPTQFSASVLQVVGTATIDTSGIANANGSDFYVYPGTGNTAGSISLPALTSYTASNDGNNRFFHVEGTGSQLNMANLTTLNLPGGATQFVQTSSGGTTDLSGLTTINHTGTRTIDFQTYGSGSTLKLGALGTAGINQVFMDVENGGTVLWGTPTQFTASALQVNGTATIDTSGITNANGSDFYALLGTGNTPGSLSFPALTSYTASNDGNNRFFHADGTGSQLNLANLTTLNLPGGATQFIQSNNGGTVDLSGLTTINHTGTRVVDFQVYGTGSTLKLGALGTAGVNQVFMDVENGGTVQWGTPTQFTASALQVNGTTTVNTSGITNANGSDFYAQLGNGNTPGSLSLPALNSYTASNDGNNRVFQANGAGSQLNMASLTTLTLAGGATQFMQAFNGATLDLSGLTTLNRTDTRALDFQVYGAGSTLKLDNATTGLTAVILDVENSATFQWGTSNTDGSDFYAYTGGSLSLPNLASYTASNDANNRVFHSDGAGSQMNLGSLTTLNLPGGGTEFVQTYNGATTDLSGLTTINHTGTRAISFQTIGAGATLKLTALGPTINQVTMDVQDGGTVQWGTPTQFTTSLLQVNGPATINTAGISNANGSDFYTFLGTGNTPGAINLPALNVYTASNDGSNRFFQVNGAGSQLNMPNLTTLNLPGGATQFVQAFIGGSVDLHSLSTITHTGTRTVDFQSHDTGSLIDLSGLHQMIAPGDTIDLANNGTVHLGGAGGPFTLNFNADFQNTLGPLNIYYESTLIETITANNVGLYEPYSFLINSGVTFVPNGFLSFVSSGTNAGVLIQDYRVALVPEPATLSLLALAAGAMVLTRRRKAVGA